MRVLLVVGVAALAALTIGVAACDSRATASDPASSRGEPKSKEYESCGASAQCADELRCFEHACRRTSRSTVGDYYASAGALARPGGGLSRGLDRRSPAIAP